MPRPTPYVEIRTLLSAARSGQSAVKRSADDAGSDIEKQLFLELADDYKRALAVVEQWLHDPADDDDR